MNVERAKQRFLRRIEKSFTPDGCWIWNHTRTSNGYGAMMVEGKRYRAHRLAYILFRSPVTEERMVLHKCDVKLCVNPDHLYVGTHQDNVHDIALRGHTGPPAARRAHAETWAVRYLGTAHVLTRQELYHLSNMLRSYAADRVAEALRQSA